MYANKSARRTRQSPRNGAFSLFTTAVAGKVNFSEIRYRPQSHRVYSMTLPATWHLNTKVPSRFPRLRISRDISRQRTSITLFRPLYSINSCRFRLTTLIIQRINLSIGLQYVNDIHKVITVFKDKSSAGSHQFVKISFKFQQHRMFSSYLTLSTCLPST